MCKLPAFVERKRGRSRNSALVEFVNVDLSAEIMAAEKKTVFAIEAQVGGRMVEFNGLVARVGSVVFQANDSAVDDVVIVDSDGGDLEQPLLRVRDNEKAKEAEIGLLFLG